MNMTLFTSRFPHHVLRQVIKGLNVDLTFELFVIMLFCFASTNLDP